MTSFRTPDFDDRRPAGPQPRSRVRIDVPQLLMLLALAGGAFIIIGSQGPWGRLELAGLGPIPGVVITVDGSSPGRDGARILLLGIVVAAIAAVALLSRPFLLRANAQQAKLVMAGASVVHFVLSVYVALLAERDIEALRDRVRLARDLGLGFLARYASLEWGLPLVLVGAGLVAVAGVAGAVVVLRPRREG